ncbi:hypothetical protein AB1E18_012551 [Capra hircus]
MSPLPGPSWGPLPRGGAQAFRVAVVPGSRHRCPSALDRGEKRRPTLRAPEAPAAHHGGLVLLGTRPGPGPRPPTAPAQEAAPHLRACTPGPGALACGPDSWLFWPQRAQPRLRPSPASEEARPASLRVAAGLPPRQGALRAQPSPLPGAGQKAELQPPAPRIPKFLAPPSTSRPQDGSKGHYSSLASYRVCSSQSGELSLAPPFTYRATPASESVLEPRWTPVRDSDQNRQGLDATGGEQPGPPGAQLEESKQTLQENLAA